MAYASPTGSDPSWNLTRQWNWQFTPQMVLSDVKDQGSCSKFLSIPLFFSAVIYRQRLNNFSGSCAAFSVASAMETAYSLISPTNYYYPPAISVQQFLDCGANSCQGGWIGDVFDYASRMFVVDDWVSPYLAFMNTPNCQSTQVIKC